MDIPITDNHIHVDAINGEGPLEVARKFQRAGGRRMIIPNKPSWTVNAGTDYRKTMDTVLKYVDIINRETEVDAYAVVGLHPAELSRLLEAGKELREAEEMIMEGLEYARSLVLEGRAVAIGEVGRPHYPVGEEELEAHNRLMLLAMEFAAEASCPVQLHTESSGPEEFREFAEMADRAGIRRSMVIKHFSGPCTRREENHGLTPSLIASRDVVKKGIEKGGCFLMETDYLDDRGRPGAVLGPRTVPRRTLEFLDKGIFSEEDAYRIHQDTVEGLYGI
ncbi:TatD family hydrolase [Methanothermobacter wolfeii]|uniref:TatD family hydrolase n=1 Tax=Methanothermobacter wolfeii TaxID=145261 RepID=UPI0024B3A147|nr:TatD family hydrolase [Methanothermobacter wolfeii]MDI6701499.1 TatD family hydrolase [Methanothermobacter wolfeii]MDI6842730.1 TatD family hydrolase [Methanothermobacter wolfeii]